MDRDFSLFQAWFRNFRCSFPSSINSATAYNRVCLLIVCYTSFGNRRKRSSHTLTQIIFCSHLSVCVTSYLHPSPSSSFLLLISSLSLYCITLSLDSSYNQKNHRSISHSLLKAIVIGKRGERLVPTHRLRLFLFLLTILRRETLLKTRKTR